MHTWTLLRRLRDVDNLPWVCGGDFNELLSTTEKLGGSEKTIRDIIRFRQVVDDCGLIDLGFSRPKFTWNNRREGCANVQERLDRILATTSWKNIFRHAVRRASKRFQFETCWLREGDIDNVVSGVWEEGSPSLSTEDLTVKLGRCANRLSDWSQTRFGNTRKKIEEKSRIIESLYRRSRENNVMRHIQSLEREVEGLIESDELYWKQRSRADWLSAGDRNTKYFHHRALARKKKNYIPFLLDNYGIQHESIEGMATMILDYFSNIFASSNPSADSIRKAIAAIKTRLSEEMKSDLLHEFRPEEIKDALFSLGPTKAPGPDGYHAIFFQKFWHILGPDVSQVCLHVLQGEMSIREFNYTNVVLILKIPNPLTPKDFRPISLCSVVYKIITKVLVNRIKRHFPCIILEQQ
ncbi:hypothetical protein LWI29_019063 [Acer saccharum]|uniref:Reverse transcriptase n=1 Tax=Acer saccharum TaxID=4024 RepID=A0AA39RL60_ACESA|nr:hypothetical protein LWI29_019063 [Acer saccharum]